MVFFFPSFFFHNHDRELSCKKLSKAFIYIKKIHKMRSVSSLKEYSSLKEEAGNGLGLVVHFSASWCEPCKNVRSMLEGYLSQYNQKVLFAEVDADLVTDVCEAENVECVPFIAFFRTSLRERAQERVADVVGGKLDHLEMNLVSLYGNGHDTRESFPDLNEYLKYLTSRKGVVAFITGTPSRPRCGFTGRLVEIFYELGIKFIYYDVWASDEVCEGLKKYSEWPTYPQVYVDGELIGGYDICSQLKESGELKAILKH
ncbi:thioredoxin-like protein, putative [Trypanosoma cruzi]|uniref:Thioredoxin-like protein, putative n=2 Tax=Trypanosoma cruzi TaxID=5693 RepID=Q4DDZ3_TRYCC|nr:thioredoxin-like protein, putative [Trypanosoma cruzi]EAN90752.1 thioredoxin-like protein, putative [Trypanosoma cruzi]|eukprot:XP_812603.1 thioredoxin-like protein [Trypanosoma cruzi strain CL Brener]